MLLMLRPSHEPPLASVQSNLLAESGTCVSCDPLVEAAGLEFNVPTMLEEEGTHAR